MDNSQTVAVIGMAGRFPGAASVDELWRMLKAGGSAVSIPSDAELRALGVREELLKNPNYVRARMRFDGADLFDAAFFGYSAKHAQMLDPQQRLFLECAWQALEAAGYDPETYGGSIGVFAGCGTNVYLLDRAQLAYRDIGSWRKSDWADMLIDADKDHVATRVSYKLGLTGPSVGVQTTCSSSLVAVHMACQSLLRGECDLALAGGVSLISCQHLRGYVYAKDGMDSPDGYCRAFDANAAGTAWGSGLGIVVLKRYEEALEDRDHLRALIEGSAINNDGAAKMGYMAPSVRGQQEVVALAQAVAGVAPRDIDLIEAHGTGTSLGDSIELAALLGLFGADSPGNRGRTCALGSIKTNIGHLDVAAGVTGLIKAVLCLENQAFVPSLNFSSPNPALRPAECPLYVNTEYRHWPQRQGRPRRAGVSALGFGGTNAHAVVREAPSIVKPDKRPAGVHIFPLSARGPAALASVRSRLAEHLRDHTEIDLADVAFTLQVGRRRFRHRQAIIADGREQLLAALQAQSTQSAYESATDRTDCALVLAFCGEQTASGAAVESLYSSDAALRSDMDECARFCRAYADADVIAAACGRSGHEVMAAGSTFAARAARFAVEYCIARLWLRWGAAPAMTVGYGSGRYAAACIAGRLALEAAVGALLTDEAPTAQAGTVVVYHAGSAAERSSPPARWQDAVRDTHCLFLQLGPGNVWADLLQRELAHEHRPALLSSFAEDGCASQRHRLQMLARMWLHGVRIDWRSFHAGEQRLRVPLPTYPFERASYWIPAPEIPRGSWQHAVEHAPMSSAQRFFVPSWRVASTSERRSSAIAEAGECWLILADGGVGERLASRLEAEGYLPVIVVAGAQFGQFGERRFSIAPESASDYSKLLRELHARDLHPQRFVHCWTLSSAAGTAATAEAFSQQQTLGYFSLLYLAKALAAQAERGQRSLVVATRGTYRVADGDPCDLANATLPGLCKVMAQELSNLSCTLLDLCGESAASSSERCGSDAQRILAEAAHGWTDPVVAYRGELRLVQILEPEKLTADLPRLRELRERGVYVITGGLGKIGLALAKRLARACRARLVLLTRSAFPARDAWPRVEADARMQAVAAKIRAIAEIESIGSEVAVFCADVRSEAQLERAFAQAESRLGPIAGVFHLAADMSHPSVNRPLADLSREDVEAQMAPKVAGFYALARVLRQREPDFGVLFSSNSSVLGGFGFGAYAAANSFLDHCVGVESFNDRFQWICTNWDRWIGDDTGVPADNDPERYTIGTEEGLDALWTIMGHCAARQVIVAASIQERRDRWVLQRHRPAPPAGQASAPPAARVRPRTELERTILQIWQEVLGCGEIGVEDSFLDLGGDSLIGLRILARLRELFQVEISLKALLGPRPTVASLVLQLVSELQRADAGPPGAGASDGPDSLHPPALRPADSAEGLPR